jgi:hypothetical protein
MAASSMLCRPKRIGQVIFNTLFTMDLWSDLSVALDLALGDNTKVGLFSACFFFAVASPLDFMNLCMRTSYSLEDLPDRSHLFNVIFETPMLAFNLYLVLGCGPSCVWCERGCAWAITFRMLRSAQRR